MDGNPVPKTPHIMTQEESDHIDEVINAVSAQVSVQSPSPTAVHVESGSEPSVPAAPSPPLVEATATPDTPIAPVEPSPPVPSANPNPVVPPPSPAVVKPALLPDKKPESPVPDRKEPPKPSEPIVHTITKKTIEKTIHG